ncbi:MAG: Zn-ribbon domain-containing OB-fold protein [Mycobacteriales bacterium]
MSTIGELPAPVTMVTTPVHLEYSYSPGLANSRFLRALQEGRIVGQRCPRCRKVYLPPRGACSMCGVATVEEVELAHTGTVTSFCVVNIPGGERPIACPYVCAQVLIDGAHLTAMFLLQEIDPAEVRMGLRVEAVWVPPEERAPSLESIRYFRPAGQPDAPYESYREYV